ncbi:UNKNOWN [Stylonychia lemnae]|uniref:Uncharacterized protein n=1 Tax=Stylonychia lemnae TaxID=5949 RepID=A0A078AXA6_STYLE|nr:UNKNOWN [Stylonychia lemnae]|eukprot:CDW86706.1 UNKNOWN [Stylonychia lemnae]
MDSKDKSLINDDKRSYLLSTDANDLSQQLNFSSLCKLKSHTYLPKQNIDSQINRRFAKEFARLVTLMNKIVRIMAEIDPIDSFNQDKYVQKEQLRISQQILKEKEDKGDVENQKTKAKKQKVEQISQTQVNNSDGLLDSPAKQQEKKAKQMEEKKIMQEMNQNNKEKLSSEFNLMTDTLLGLKKILESIPIENESKAGANNIRLQSLWNFYKKDLLTDHETDFVCKMKTPKIILSEENLGSLRQIDQMSKSFQTIIDKATIVKCGCFCRYKKHFMVPSVNGVKIDCMFFPCTNESNLEISIENPKGEYLSKPTFIMCNPNALIYQQMVTSPNAYWLSFFLKRGINVMCWNYRGYGKSQQKWYSSSIDPYTCKQDVEKVLEFLLQKQVILIFIVIFARLKVRGKIGVYGRSIGGIASCHLANKYPAIIEAAIIDRTLNELLNLSQRRLTGQMTSALFKFISYNWKALNDHNIIQSKCFKIITTDPRDDVVENFSSLPVGVAMKLAKLQYKEDKWRQLFMCFQLIYDCEDQLYSNLDESQLSELNFRLIQSFKDTTTAYKSPRESNEIQEQSMINTMENDEETLIKHSQKIKKHTKSQLQSQLSLGYLKQRFRYMKRFQEIHQQLHTLMIMLDDIQAGPIPLRELVNKSRIRSFREFQIFLQTLEVYGVGYPDDIDRAKYANRAVITHSQQTIEQLKQLIHVYQKSISTFIELDLEHFEGQISFKNNLVVFLQYQIECFNDLIDIQSKRSLLNENDFDKITEGHLVLMKCGHRGKPSRIEEKRISRLLRKSGFIPMLEEIQYYKQASPRAKEENKNDNFDFKSPPKDPNNTPAQLDMIYENVSQKVKLSMGQHSKFLKMKTDNHLNNVDELGSQENEKNHKERKRLSQNNYPITQQSDDEHQSRIGGSIHLQKGMILGQISDNEKIIRNLPVL